MNKNNFKFMISLFLLLSTAVIVFYFENILNELETYFFPVIFIYFMYDFSTILFPKFNKNISSSKHFKLNYKSPNKYNSDNLNNYVIQQNKKAILIFILYTIMIVLIALMYWKIAWFSKKFLYLIFFAINFGDYYCIHIWCPFQKLF
jgi:anaerobic C4-dicarboxylate transporter